MREALRRFFDGDVWHSFRNSPVAMTAPRWRRCACSAPPSRPWVAPHDPFDLASLELADSRLPPAWDAEGKPAYLLGTDDQGPRHPLGADVRRAHLAAGGAGVGAAVGAGGREPGAAVGFVGGRIDAFVMRVCDVMLSFPAILIALLIDGVGRALFPNAHDTLAFAVLILAIALSGWVKFARTVRGSTLVERHKEYVQAARVIGVPSGASWAATCCPT